MIRLGFESTGREGMTVLCLGRHSDNTEIECGGIILRLAKQCPQANSRQVVFCAAGVRGDAARWAAEQSVEQGRLRGPELHSFRDGYLPCVGGEVKDEF
jgi:LmbE family N-acetylglucosaminyl deacetylase